MNGDMTLGRPDWRTSSHSSQGADCVQVALIDTDDRH
jgi:Domain of unknown function (DUF397)